MKIWTTEEEASALDARFEGVNRAAFARNHRVKGGQAMIYQHITGRRPINIEAAMAYAEGFGCSLAEISPRLAAEVQKAAALASDAGPSETPPAESSWPFPEVSPGEYESLSTYDKKIVENLIRSMLTEKLKNPRPPAPDFRGQMEKVTRASEANRRHGKLQHMQKK